MPNNNNPQRAAEPRQPNNNMAPPSGKKRRRKPKNTNAPKMGLSQRMRTQAAAPPSYTNTTRGVRKLLALKDTNISQQGYSFLKCAFAPPDFFANDTAGVPDEFEGQSLVKKHRSITPCTFTPNTDYWYLLAPTPGIAFYVVAVTAGTPITADTVWQPVYYSDSATLFGPTTGVSAANIVSRFRYVSNHFEFVPTTNSMQWTGTIQVLKCQVNFVTRNQNTIGGNFNTILGLNASNGIANANQYTAPYIQGCYVGAYNNGAKFDFSEIIEGYRQVPSTIDASQGDFGALQGFYGLDNNFESVMIRISGIGMNNANTGMVKTWSCVEYQAIPGSSVYEYQTISPYNPAALQAYRQIIKGLPLAVSYLDNDSFWERVLRILKQITRAGSYIPGPAGMIAGGANAVVNGISGLVL